MVSMVAMHQCASTGHKRLIFNKTKNKQKRNRTLKKLAVIAPLTSCVFVPCTLFSRQPFPHEWFFLNSLEYSGTNPLQFIVTRQPIRYDLILRRISKTNFRVERKTIKYFLLVFFLLHTKCNYFHAMTHNSRRRMLLTVHVIARMRATMTVGTLWNLLQWPETLLLVLFSTILFLCILLKGPGNHIFNSKKLLLFLDEKYSRWNREKYEQNYSFFHSNWKCCPIHINETQIWQQIQTEQNITSIFVHNSLLIISLLLRKPLALFRFWLQESAKYVVTSTFARIVGEE